MPPGPKKRKAAKRKNQNAPVDIHQDDSPTDPNPNSRFLPPLIHPQGNWRDTGIAPIEDDVEEAFETPRFQPETPRCPETPYYSIGNTRSGRRDDFEGSSEVALMGEKLKGLGVEIPSEEEEEEESSKEMKLDESAAADDNYNGLLHEEIASEEGEDGRKDDEGLKEAKLDESVHVTEVESSNTKEVKVVPLSDGAILTDNGEVNVDDNADIQFERNIERELKRNREMLADNGELIADVECAHSDEEGYINFRGNNGDVESEGFDSVLENLTKVVESGSEKLPQIDADLANNELEKSVEKSSVSVENTALNTKVQCLSSTAYQENAAEPSSHVEEADARKNEAGGGRLEATFWNCCGWLDVFTRSDK